MQGADKGDVDMARVAVERLLQMKTAQPTDGGNAVRDVLVTGKEHNLID